MGVETGLAVLGEVVLLSWGAFADGTICARIDLAAGGGSLAGEPFEDVLEAVCPEQDGVESCIVVFLEGSA